jgi:hypothetical protein
LAEPRGDHLAGTSSLRKSTSKRAGQSVPIGNVAVAVAVNDRRYNAETDQLEDTGKTVYEVTISGERAVHFGSSALNGTRLLAAATSSSTRPPTPKGTSGSSGHQRRPPPACPPSTRRP